MNRYFIINSNDVNIDAIMLLVIGEFIHQRFNKEHTKLVVKLPIEDKNNYEILVGYTEYTHKQILEELQNPEWSTPLE